MKIAVIGAGISGLGAAYAMAGTHDVHVYERDDRIGGHANTVDATFPNGVQPVDTGFIVYNARNYPNLVSLFDHLDVPTKWSDMSFGFSMDGGGLEYACDNLDKLFAQRRRIADPRFIHGVSEILRFTKQAPRDLDAGHLTGQSLGFWIAERKFSAWFRDRFILPMGGAIWSTPAADILDFPAESFVRFFVNHDLMTGLAPAMRWRTVDGGSREYVSRLIAQLGDRVVRNRAAVAVTQGPRPSVRFADGSEDSFDQVVLACHGPHAYGLLCGKDGEQDALLSAFRTSENTAILHSDPALMPKRRKVWSSWNFLTDSRPEAAARPAQVSYWMNRLQSLPEDRPLFVSLNPQTEPDPALVHRRFSYAHPLYDTAAFAAQPRMDGIQGRGGVWYAGAWLGYGFHEDGLRSGLRVAEALGCRPDWVRDTATPILHPTAQAAE